MKEAIVDLIGSMMKPKPDSLEQAALDLLVRATSGHASTADLKALEVWRSESDAHADAYRRAFTTWSAVGTAAREVASAQDRAMVAGSGVSRSAVSRRSLLVSGGAMAASVATAGVVVLRPPLDLWPSLSELRADYRTAPGEQREIAFAEGVDIEMNTRTSVVRHAAVDAAAQLELLAGEAVIRAALHGASSLTVTASGMNVIASRAQFNLRNDPDSARVVCLEGTVRVECRDETRELSAGQQLAYAGGHLGALTTVDTASVTAWRRGLLVFHDEPLTGVVAEVNRYWRGRLVLLNRELGRRRVTMRVELTRIGEVVPFIQSVLGARARTLPGGIVLLT